MTCFCGQPAVTHVPTTEHEARCLTHTIEYFTKLVACGAERFRAGDYVPPGSLAAWCRGCEARFTYLPRGERSRSNRTLCDDCYRLARRVIARQMWQTRPASQKYPRRLRVPVGLGASPA